MEMIAALLIDIVQCIFLFERVDMAVMKQTYITYIWLTRPHQVFARAGTALDRHTDGEVCGGRGINRHVCGSKMRSYTEWSGRRLSQLQGP